jgi:hypothetical protein
VFADNLKPNDIARAEYDNNSINTNNGAKANGHPAGTNKLKKVNPCVYNPIIVTPNHITTDNDIINTI